VNPSRESIYSAMFAVLAATPGLNGSGRVYRPWSQVSDAEQPYLIMREFGEGYDYTAGGSAPAKKTLIANVILYSRVNDPNAPGAIALNDLMDALEATLMPQLDVGIPQQLGGKVRWCRIQGRQTIYEGDLQQQAVSVLEIHTLAMGGGY
jgi:hypothetical protein